MNEFKGINTEGLEKAVDSLAKACMMTAETVNQLSLTQDEFNEMIALFDGSVEHEETINTSDYEVTVMEVEDITNSEVLYYLEEMIDCGLACEIEMNVYYDIKLMRRCKRRELKYVKSKMIKMYNEKF